jgi:hypothetical protein
VSIWMLLLRRVFMLPMGFIIFIKV